MSDPDRLLVSAKVADQATIDRSSPKAFEHPDGRVNIHWIVVQFRIRPGTFHDRQRRGWPGLGSGTLQAEERVSPITGYKEYTYERCNVEKAMRLPVDAERIDVEGETRLTKEQLMGDLGIKIDTLLGWEDDECPYLDGKRLESIRAVNRLTGRSVKTYSTADRDAILERKRQAEQGRLKYKDRFYLSVKRSMRVLTIKRRKRNHRRPILWEPNRLVLIYQWVHLGCCHLPKDKYPDGKLSPRRFKYMRTGKGGGAYWFPEDEILTVKESLKANLFSTFDGVFNEPEGKRLSLRAAAYPKSMFSAPCLYVFVQRLPLEFHHVFQESKLPSQFRPHSGKDVEIITILETDLRRLESEAKSLFKANARRRRGLLTTDEALTRYGITILPERLEAASLLKQLREAGILTEYLMLWPLKQKNGVKRRPWCRRYFYDPDELDRQLTRQYPSDTTPDVAHDDSVMPSAESRGANFKAPSERSDEPRLQDINPFPARVLEFAPAALEQLRHLMEPNKLPKSQPGRPRTNGHFLDYFEEKRKTYKQEDKSNKQIYLDYKKEHPEEPICKKKTEEKYLDACRAAISELRQTKPEKNK